ncbi:MAG: hypothetical protein WD847_13410 [Pirellulales bacterium]
MIPGLIVGEVRDRVTDRPVDAALVGLNHVTGDPSRGLGRLALHDGNGLQCPNLYAVTDSGGLFTLYFSIDPLHFADLTGSIGRPAFQLNVQRPDGPYSYAAAHRHTASLVPVISLRAIAEGRLPTLDELDSLGTGGTIAKLALQIAIKIRNAAGRQDVGLTRMPTLRFPNMFLNPGRPSPEYVEVLGSAEIYIR